jgi:dTDP-D-glucose 4,6-dehydratase
MHISVYNTKDASAYRVFLDGEEVKDWIEADDTAGTVEREVPTGKSGGARFLRRETVRGVVVIRAPEKAE